MKVYNVWLDCVQLAKQFLSEKLRIETVVSVEVRAQCLQLDLRHSCIADAHRTIAIDSTIKNVIFNNLLCKKVAYTGTYFAGTAFSAGGIYLNNFHFCPH